jgi:hypothetical protein
VTKQLWGYHIATLEPGETLTGVRYDKERRRFIVDTMKATVADDFTISVGCAGDPDPDDMIHVAMPITVGTKP